MSYCYEQIHGKTLGTNGQYTPDNYSTCGTRTLLMTLSGVLSHFWAELPSEA